MLMQENMEISYKRVKQIPEVNKKYLREQMH